MTQRQAFQSLIQFLTVLVASLATLYASTGTLPTVEQAYGAVLAGLAGALAIFTASKARVGDG